MFKLLDRLFTREVVCRNCPNFRRVKDTLAYSGGKEHTVTLGVCALQAPVIASYPKMAEALPVRYKGDWCAQHPAYKPLAAKSDADAPPLAYAPELIPGAGLGDNAGFSRAPSLGEALQYAPKKNGENNKLE